jgi:periplasmic divalent cation tolerance protein
MDPRYLIVLITVPSREAGEQVAQQLLEKKLAACVNFIPAVHSLYIWQGEITADDELLLVVKTRADLFEEQLVPAVKAVHPYEVPEIIALPILMGSKSYLDWIEESTQFHS